MTVVMNCASTSQVANTAVVADSSPNREKTLSDSTLGVFNNKTDETTHRNPFDYQVLPLQLYAFPKDNEALVSALKRVEKTYPELYEDYLAEKKISSEEEILKNFIRKLSKGCCAGRVYAIYDKIHRQESCSLEQIVSSMRPEDYFYFQILVHIFTSTNKLKWELEKHKIRKELHVSAFFKSEKFSIGIQGDYSHFLKKVIRQFPGGKNFVGAIHIPEHVIGFQYGSQGYFLYDSANATKDGLCKYPTATIFFQQLRRHVVEDTLHQILSICKKNDPTADQRRIDKNVDHLIKQVRPYYVVHPLTPNCPLTTNTPSLRQDAIKHLPVPIEAVEPNL